MYFLSVLNYITWSHTLALHSVCMVYDITIICSVSCICTYIISNNTGLHITLTFKFLIKIAPRQHTIPGVLKFVNVATNLCVVGNGRIFRI